MSAKKHSIQQNYQPSTLVPNMELINQGEISSDRQTLKMNDFLKQMEAYSNDKLDKIMP